MDESRSHYELVGKSTLRKPQAISLGAQYAGSRISREAVEQDDEDDPFGRDFDSEVSQEEGSEQGHMNDNDVELSDEELQPDEEKDRKANGHPPNGIDRVEIRKLMANDHKAVAANLSRSARADAEKGRAVKEQRATFDALLNVRIKLQKALVAVNSIPLILDQKTREQQDTVGRAETAAMTLFNNISSLRSSLDTARTGKKRKHSAISSPLDIAPIWNEIQAVEAENISRRKSIVDFWSAKSRATTTTLQNRRLSAAQTEQSLTDVLEGQLSDMQRLISRTRIPRSCAPIQAAKASQKQVPPSSETDLPIYDDADLYSLLLQNLISQRSDDATSLSVLNVNVMEPWQAAREAKIKKVVDTRASKGRKLRYTVHEKLQNFMAPEDRTTWGGRQSDELFGSLFGRKVELAEGDDDVEDENEEVEGLKLFAQA